MQDATIKPSVQARCLGCGRPLRTAKSIAAQRGPVCARKVRRAEQAVDTSDYQPHQLAARLLLAA